MKWSKKEEEILMEGYNLGSLENLSNKLGKSVKSIKQKAAREGLSRGRSPKNKPKDKSYRKKKDKEYYEVNKIRIYENKQKRLKNKKGRFVKLLGGKCFKCGYDKCFTALDFHHVDKGKEYNITHIIKNGSEQKALKEVNKCILLCANCHRELHSKS